MKSDTIDISFRERFLDESQLLSRDLDGKKTETMRKNKMYYGNADVWCLENIYILSQTLTKRF
jgi:hypothetical protein